MDEVEKRIELWQWRYTDQFGKRRVYPCRLSAAAAAQLKDAERVDGSRVVHRSLGSTSDFLKSAPKR